MTRAARRLVLGPPAVACLAYPALPAPSLTQTGVFLGVILWSLAAMAAGVRHHRPTRARVWWALLAGTAAWAVGEVLWAWNVWVWEDEPFPSVADGWFLLGYVLLAVGLAWLVRGRQPGRDRAALVDATVVTLGVGVLTSAFVVLPLALASDQTLLGRVVGSAYPLTDLLLLGLLVRLLGSPGRATAAYRLLVAGLLATLLADAGYNGYTLVNADAPIPGWMDACWLAYYVLAAAAALHPSMRVLSEPAPEREERLTRRRLLALAAACALAPLTIVGQVLTGQAAAAVVVSAVGSLVLSSLVLLRMAGLLQRVRSQAVQLAALASVDALTGVPNRRTWDFELSRACAAARQDGLPLAIALLDLDRFKAFNDAYGHQAGDRLLREGAAAWSSVLRPGDLLARYGGEEFALLLPASVAVEACAVLERLRPLTPRGQTFSAGVAVWDGSEEPARAVARADRALYDAKHAGRDCVRQWCAPDRAPTAPGPVGALLDRQPGEPAAAG